MSYIKILSCFTITLSFQLGFCFLICSCCCLWNTLKDRWHPEAFILFEAILTSPRYHCKNTGMHAAVLVSGTEPGLSLLAPSCCSCCFAFLSQHSPSLVWFPSFSSPHLINSFFWTFFQDFDQCLLWELMAGVNVQVWHITKVGDAVNEAAWSTLDWIQASSPLPSNNSKAPVQHLLECRETSQAQSQGVSWVNKLKPTNN